MRITKLAQSTVDIVTNNNHILIDPGIYNYSEGLISPKEHQNISILIITHIHADHFHLEAVRTIIETSSPTILTNKEVGDELLKAGIACRTAQPGNEIVINDLKIQLVPIDHVVEGKRIDGFGVLLEVDGKIIYHASDTLYMDDKPNADIVFVPINNRGVSMGIDDAVRFTVDISPQIVIPIHYDSPKDKGIVDPNEFARKIKKVSTRINVRVLSFGETFEF